MNPSSLRLERHVFDHIHVEALPEREKGAEVKLEIKCESAQRTDDPHRAQLKLRVAFGPRPGDKVGYQGAIQILGNFQLDPSNPPEKLFELIATEGATLLFGAVRELVCNLTARGPWPMMRIPNISFQVPGTKGQPRLKKATLSKSGKSDPKAS